MAELAVIAAPLRRAPGGVDRSRRCTASSELQQTSASGERIKVHQQRRTDESFALNRLSWDERVDGHMASSFYDVAGFLAGRDTLSPIEKAEIGDVAGQRILHLQCHFGLDSLSLARRGAEVTGLDFSSNAVAAARQLARQTGIGASFVEGNVYDAPALLPAGEWDIVFTSWGTVTWLPDIAAWAGVVAQMLAPGGRLYFLDCHPVASALHQGEPDAPIQPTYDYFHGSVPLEFEEEGSYADAEASFTSTRTHEWIHPLGTMITGIIEAGMHIQAVRDHDGIAWQLFPSMTCGQDGLWRLPQDAPRIPLSVTIEAGKPLR